MALARCLIEYGDAEFTRDTGEAIGRARELYTTAGEVLADSDLQLPATMAGSEVAFTSPTLLALQLKVAVQLAKIRQGRNIAGLQRRTPQLDEPLAALPTAGIGVPAPPDSSARTPTPYRFRVLLDRARQLVALAQQLEAAYLGAVEKHDQAEYRRADAGYGLELADATVELQTRRLVEARQGKTIANQQSSRAAWLSGQYQTRLDADLNEYERAALDNIWQVKTLRDVIAGIDAALGVAQQAQQAASITSFFDSFGVKQGIAAGIAVAYIGKGIATGFLDAQEASLQSNQMLASHERQMDEWRLQKGLADQDKLIADQQVLLASDHVSVAEQEKAVADVQSRHARAIVDLLDRQFTNAELYEWMSGVLTGIYRYLLQQAVATARLAQDQLAFERGQAPSAIVQSDYWAPPDAANGQAAGASSDRRGLTGAERLLQDVTQLDQYAFETDRRKLNVTQTFSLAQRLPLQFQQLQDTGILQFATPMHWFDEAYPGQYLRLVRRVRISVSALIPPGQGIRATLASSGVSRVVTGGDVFRRVLMHRPPEIIALSSPIASTGVFELDAQSDMLLPFEAMGVETDWELQIPKAANAFDFRSLADVIMTVEFTALYDYGYRQQTMIALNANRTRGGDRLFSIRNDFQDAWYAASNADGAVPAITLMIGANDFPSNLEGVEVADVVLYAAPLDGAAVALGATLTHNGKGGTEQGANGIISTRTANAPTWAQLRSQSPLGDWTLTLDGPTTALLEQGRLRDLLLVIGYRGRLPAWPT
jgi:hypothetical protein